MSPRTSLRTAARALCNPKAALVITGLTASGLGGCTHPLSDVGFIGMDETTQAQFTPVCHATNGNIAVVYRDNAHDGDTYVVQVEGQRTAYVEASIKQGGIHFSGSFNGGENGSPGSGVHLNGTQTYGDLTEDAIPAWKKNMIWRAADKGLTDIHFNQILPGRPCELAYGYGWRRAMLYPAAY